MPFDAISFEKPESERDLHPADGGEYNPLFGVVRGDDKPFGARELTFYVTGDERGMKCEGRLGSADGLGGLFQHFNESILRMERRGDFEAAGIFWILDLLKP